MVLAHFSFPVEKTFNIFLIKKFSAFSVEATSEVMQKLHLYIPQASLFFVVSPF